MNGPQDVNRKCALSHARDVWGENKKEEMGKDGIINRLLLERMGMDDDVAFRQDKTRCFVCDGHKCYPTHAKSKESNSPFHTIWMEESGAPMNLQ